MKSVIKQKTKEKFFPHNRALAQYRGGNGEVKVVVVLMEKDQMYPDKDYWRVMCLHASGDGGWALFEICGGINFDSPKWEAFEGTLEITV